MDSDNAGCVSSSTDDRSLTYSTLANSPAELLGSGQSCRNGCVFLHQRSANIHYHRQRTIVLVFFCLRSLDIRELDTPKIRFRCQPS
jgi:hypothetical protein